MSDNSIYAIFVMCIAFVIITAITQININSIVYMKLNVKSEAVKSEVVGKK